MLFFYKMFEDGEIYYHLIFRINFKGYATSIECFKLGSKVLYDYVGYDILGWYVYFYISAWIVNDSASHLL